MKNKLRCSKILIIGGGSGIGKAIAERLLQEGVSVLITGRNEKKLQAVKKELSSNKLFCSQFDITDIGNHTSFFERSAELMDGLDGFVNAAALGGVAVFGEERSWEPFDITEDEWDLMSDTNLKSAYFLMRNEVEYLRKNNIKGNVLNISSNAACMDISGIYGASKLSILKWTRAWSKLYGGNGIIINGIAPGATATPMIAHYCKDENDPYERHTIGRFIKPYEIAELAYYLMSEFGEIICGHTVIADGGDKIATL